MKMTMTLGGGKRLDCGHIVNHGENFYLLPKNIKKLFQKK
jgi:hypothetical protein